MAAAPIAGEARLYNTVYETRTMLAFRLRHAALEDLLPAGWRIVDVADGPAKGANFRFGLSDQMAAIDAEGRPAEAHRFCPMTVTVIRDGMSKPQRLAIGGWSTGSDPGRMRHPGASGRASGAPDGVRQPDTAEIERSVRIAASGSAQRSETWRFASPRGVAAEQRAVERAFASMSDETLTFSMTWRGGELVRGAEEFRIYSLADPDIYRQYRIEKVEETVLSLPLGIDRTEHVEYEATGPRLSALFDGSEQLINIAVQPFGRREIHLF